MPRTACTGNIRRACAIMPPLGSTPRTSRASPVICISSRATVAPTYDNAATLRDVITRAARIGLPVFVINDGSSDATPGVLAELRHEMPSLQVVTHAGNCGKAAALRSGFALAGAAGHTH